MSLLLICNLHGEGYLPICLTCILNLQKWSHILSRHNECIHIVAHLYANDIPLFRAPCEPAIAQIYHCVCVWIIVSKNVSVLDCHSCQQSAWGNHFNPNLPLKTPHNNFGPIKSKSVKNKSAGYYITWHEQYCFANCHTTPWGVEAVKIHQHHWTKKRDFSCQSFIVQSYFEIRKDLGLGLCFINTVTPVLFCFL